MNLSEKTKEINDIIFEYLPLEGGHTAYITEAMNYSVSVGGKRLRPMIMRESYKLFAGDWAENEILKRFMAGLEFIHNYSLVHDDLPAMDNDMFRRGQLTTHAKYGEAFGVLTGDALLNWAFETVLKGMAELEDAEEMRKSVKALDVLAIKAGIYGMVGGQCMDVLNEKHPEMAGTDTYDELRYINDNKTAALLEASLMIGAILAGASDEDVATLELIGNNVGFAFQVRDDILDIISTDETLGKPVGSDARNGKETFATLLGLDEAQKMVERCSSTALDLLDKLGGKGTFLEELIKYLTEREK